MDWLSYITGALDKPGAAVRGVLSGELDDALHLIPFSDTLGITEAEDRKSGRDMLEAWGAVGANTPGLDGGDVAGFLAEILLDPTNYIGLGTIGQGARFLKGQAALRAADNLAFNKSISQRIAPAIAGDYWGAFDSPNQLWDTQKAQADDILRRDYHLGSLEDAWRAKGTIGGEVLYRGEQVPSASYQDLGREMNVNDAWHGENNPHTRASAARLAAQQATNLKDRDYYTNLADSLDRQSRIMDDNRHLIFASTSPLEASKYAGDTGAVFKLVHNPRRQLDISSAAEDAAGHTTPAQFAEYLNSNIGAPVDADHLASLLTRQANRDPIQWEYLRDESLQYLRPLLEREGVTAVKHAMGDPNIRNVAILDRNAAALHNEMLSATQLPPARNQYDLAQQLIGGAPKQPAADMRPWYHQPTGDEVARSRAKWLLTKAALSDDPPHAAGQELIRAMEYGDRALAAELYQQILQLGAGEIAQRVIAKDPRLGPEDLPDLIEQWNVAKKDAWDIINNPHEWIDNYTAP